MNLHDAAAARAAATAQRSHRPQQRRCAGDVAPGIATVRADLELRKKAADSDRLTFRGIASVYERGYEMWDLFGPYTEVVSAGAASDLERADLDVPLVLDHDSLRRIARTTNGSLQLTQDDEGLHVLADDLDPEDGDVAYIAPKIRAGLIDEMSFKFRIDSGRWSPDYSEYRIDSFSIHRGDVAIVGYGANPWTGEHTSLRSAPRLGAWLDLAIAR